MGSYLDVARLSDYAPKSKDEYKALGANQAEENLYALLNEVLSRVRVATELDLFKLADSPLLGTIQTTCASYAEELERARITCVPAGEDSLSPLRAIARCLRKSAGIEDSQGLNGAEIEELAQALALLIKAFLTSEQKRLGLAGLAAFQSKYNKERHQRDGHNAITHPGTFVVHLAVAGGRHVALDTQLLAVVGGFLGVDFLVLRVRRDKTLLQDAANTTITHMRIAADPDVLKLAEPYRPTPVLAPEPRPEPGPSVPLGRRPTIPLLEVLEGGSHDLYCVYRGLEPKPGALDLHASQVTNWQSAEDLRIWLPYPAQRYVPLSRLRNLDYPAGGVYWSVERWGHEQLVLRKKRCERGGWLTIDSSFGERPVVAVEIGPHGSKVLRLLRPAPTESGGEPSEATTGLPLPRAGGAALEAPAGKGGAHQQQRQGQHQQQQQPGQEEQLQQQGQEFTDEQQQRPQPQLHNSMLGDGATTEAGQVRQQQPQAGGDAKQAAQRAAHAILRSRSIGLLAQDEAGRAPSHMPARQAAKELVTRAGQVESFDPSRTPVHVATASGAGAGKTTFTNKLIAELIASRARLRAVLPRHLHGDLAPHELPGKGTKMDDVLRLFREGHGEAHEGLQGLRRFSCTIKPLKPAQAIREGGAAQAPDQSPSGVGADESPFAEGGKYDYFQPERHGVTEDVLAQVSCTWDDAVHVGKVGNRYNMCRPHVGDQKYGCFMPDGRGGHCTDRVQHVYMSVADTLDEAAFRFRWQLISREEANKQIHQYRQHIKGELAYGEIDPEAHINVPYMCGLNDDKETKQLIANATMPDDELVVPDDEDEVDDEDDDSTGTEGPSGGGGGESRALAVRTRARQILLAKLLPSLRFVPFLGHELGLEILTDDTVGASMWLEFFATRFVLGKANAAFTLRNGSAMHVPSEYLCVHIMDMPGMLGSKQRSNAMAMEEVEAGLRSVPQHMGTGHTVVVVPSHGREIDMEPIIGKLCETQVLKEAIQHPEEITIAPIVNLRRGTNAVMGKMEEPDQGGDLSFADLWDAEYLEEFKGHFQSAIKEQAQDMDLHAPGTWKRVRKELKAGRLLQTFMLDVSGRMVENTPLQDDPQANSFLVRSFVDSLVRLKEKYDESARRKMHMAMWEQLADMVYEGVWLAKRLQLLLAPVPRPSNRGGGEEDEEEGEVTSQSEMAVSEAKVHKALVEMLKLLNLQDVGTVGWEAAVREHKGGSISPNMPLRQAQLQAWVEGEGNGLRDLVHRCTPELAEERLSRRVSWSTEYKQSYNRKLGNDLTSRDLFNTDLPTYLLSPVMKRGEVVLGAALKKFVKNVVDLDIELVEAQIKHARTNVRGNDSDKDVKQMLDVYEEAITVNLRDKRQLVMQRLRDLQRGTGQLEGVDALPVRWGKAIDNPFARAAAQRVYDTTKGRKRKERLQRARTDLLHVWRESLLPGAGSGAGRAPGRLAAIVDELAEVVLQLYRRQRELFISEAAAIARSSTLGRLGPMALRVMRAGLTAARIAAKAAAAANAAAATYTTAAAASTSTAPAANTACEGSVSDELLKELQAAMQGTKQTTKTRKEELSADYGPTDPLELVLAVAEDSGLRAWVRERDGEPPQQGAERKRRRSEGAE